MDETQEPQQPMNAPHFHRWYDMDIQLSELVHSLEVLSEESQTLFAFLMGLFSDQIVKVRGREFFSELEWDKIIGIYKSKRGRRWYDREPATHKAFNKLYSLSDDDKAVIARELHVPSRIVKRYENFCQAASREPDLDIVFSIVETCFKEGPDIAQERYRDFA